MSQQLPGDPGDDVHALAAAYALDAVDADERLTFERHLATCQACQREVADLREVTVSLSDELSVEPSPALREQVLSQIARTPQDVAAPVQAPPDQVGAQRARRSRGTGRWLLAGAAAASIAIGAIAITQWPTDTPDPAVVAVQEVLDAPEAVESTESADGVTFTVVSASSLDRAVLLTEDLPQAPEGEDYQLWFVHEDGTAVSAGLIPRGDDEVALEGAPAGAVAVGITVEPAGGSEQPTSDPIVAVPLQG